MKCKLLMVAFLLLGTLTVAQAQIQPDPGIADTLRLVTTVVGSAQSAEVKAVVNVTFYNDEDLGGITLPMKWTSTGQVLLDSVSFVGTRVLYLAVKPVTIDTVAQNVKVGDVVFFEAYIPAGDGLLCKLYFTIPSGTVDQHMYMDTTFIDPASLLFTMANGFGMLPQLLDGEVTIGTPAGVDDNNPAVPLTYSLGQNYPNPFNPTTTIAYSIERKGHVNVSIYNILGQKVYNLVDREMEPGSYQATWEGTDTFGSEVASGIYFYKMISNNYVETRKMLLMR